MDYVSHPFLAPFDGSFRIVGTPTAPPDHGPSPKECAKQLDERVDKLRELQRLLYAHDHHAILLIFQAMDAAGKDGTIRAVMTGINPAGCQVFSFKKPSPNELEHDFLWRTTRCLPERGRIGIFNRSYYEEVLVVRVHPEWLAAQRLPRGDNLEKVWKRRYVSIRNHERHLARNGTVILKFWLHVSRNEQRKRFLARINEPEKNWKFSMQDVAERAHWPAYMAAYEEAVNATSRTWAPWYVIPADEKRFMRFTVADILVRRLEQLDLQYPTVDNEVKSRFSEMRSLLLADTDD